MSRVGDTAREFHADALTWPARTVTLDVTIRAAAEDPGNECAAKDTRPGRMTETERWTETP